MPEKIKNENEHENEHEHENENENFLKLFKLIQFQVFNPDPKYKKYHLTGTEMRVFFYIMYEKLLYIRKDSKAWNGNTIKMTKEFKDMLNTKFNFTLSQYERMITKLVKGGILYRIKKDFFAINPFIVCKGANIHMVRNMGVFRKQTLTLKPGESPFLKLEDKKEVKETKEVKEAKSTTADEEKEIEHDDVFFMKNTEIISMEETTEKPHTIDDFFG